MLRHSYEGAIQRRYNNTNNNNIRRSSRRIITYVSYKLIIIMIIGRIYILLKSLKYDRQYYILS